MNANDQKIFDEGRLIGLLTSGRFVIKNVMPFFETGDLTSISILDPKDQIAFTFCISSVRVEERMDGEEE